MTWTTAGLQQGFLIFLRVLGITALAPVLGSGRYAFQVKVGLALALAGILATLQAAPEAPWSLLGLAGAAGQEALLGLLTGLASRLTFTGLEMAATYIGLQSGLDMGSHLNPGFAETFQQGGTALEQAYILTVGLTFLAVDAHHSVIMAIARSLELVPPGTLALSPLGLDRLVALAGGMFSTGLAIAVPVLGTLMLADVALALVARAVPQVQVLFVGAPAKIALAIAALAGALPWMAGQIVERLSHLAKESLIFIAP